MPAYALNYDDLMYKSAIKWFCGKKEHAQSKLAKNSQRNDKQDIVLCTKRRE